MSERYANFIFIYYRLNAVDIKMSEIAKYRNNSYERVN